MPIEVDESCWPLVAVTWPAGAITNEDVVRFVEASRAQLARRERFATLHDGFTATWLKDEHRQSMAAHVNAHREEFARWHAATAIVHASAIARAIIASINWVSPHPSTQRQFATRPEAEAWLREVLAKR
jgi:hypothetical protein